MPRLYATRRTPHPTERRFDLVCKAKVNSTAGLDVREYNSSVFKSFPMCRFPWTENVTESDCRSYADQLGLRFASIEHASDAYANATTTGFKCSPTGGDSLMPSKCARTLDSKAAIYGDGGYGKYDNTYSGPDVNHRVVFSQNDGVPNGGETGWNGCEQTMRVCRLDYDAIREFDSRSKIMKQKYEGYLEAALTRNLFCANTGVQERPRLYCKTEFEWRDDVSIPITLGTPYATTPDVLGNVVPLMSSQGLIRFPTQTHTQPPPPASPILDTPVPLCHGNATCIPMYPFQQDACQQVWNMQTQGACAFDSNANSPQGAIDCSLHNCSDFIDCNHGGGALRCAIRQAGNATGHQCEAVCELVPQYGGDSSPRCGIDEVDGQIVCPASSGGDGSALFEDVYLSVSTHVPPAAPPSLQMTPPPPPFLPFPPYNPNASTVATYNLDARWQGETAHGSLARWPERLMGVMRASSRGATASSHAPGFPYTYVYQQAKDGLGGSLFDPVAQRGRIVTYEGNDAFDTRSELGAWEPAFDSSDALSMSWMMIQSDPLNSPIDLRNVGFLNVVNSMVGSNPSYTDQFGVYCLKETSASAGYLERFKQRYAFQNVRVTGVDACSENSIKNAEDRSMWAEFFSFPTSCGSDIRFGVAGRCAFGVDNCSQIIPSLPTTSPLPQANPIQKKQCYNILILARHATGNSHSLRVGLTSQARPTAV